MSDAAITTIAAAVVTVTTMGFGFLTLWIKLKYGVEKAAKDAVARAEEASATVAKNAVAADNQRRTLEKKLDENTDLTSKVNEKANTIVDQTNGALTEMQVVVKGIAERVGKLEDYNHESTHRLANTLTAIHNNVSVLLALQGKPSAPSKTEET